MRNKNNNGTFPAKCPEIEIRCYAQGGAFSAMDTKLCMFYNRSFITRERSWKLAESDWCCYSCLN